MIRPFLPPENFTSQIIITDYECLLCKGILYQPVTDFCGHLFCKTCLSNHMITNTLCPITSKSLPTQLTIVPLIEKIISNQSLKCINHKDGCQWIGLVAHISTHLTNECLYQLIECHFAECNQKTTREFIDDHISVCDYRTVRCINCQISLPFNQIKAHYSICPKALIECPQKCEVLIKRDEVDFHIEISCKKTLIKCPFHKLGCQNQLTIDTYKSHLDNEKVLHLDILYAQFIESKERDESHFIEIYNKIDKIEKLPQLIDYSITSNESMEFIGRKRAIPKSHKIFDIQSLPKEILVIGKRIKFESLSRTEHKFVFINLFDTMTINKNNKNKIDEYKWSFKLLTTTNWIAFGLCNKEKVVNNRMIFYAPGINYYDHGSFVISSNGYIWNCNDNLQNNIRGSLFSIEKDDIIDLSYFPKTLELHYEINEFSGKMTKVFSKNKEESLVPCIIFLNDGDQVELII